MKYLKKINLKDTTNNINEKEVIENSYQKGNKYYQEVEENQKQEKNSL